MNKRIIEQEGMNKYFRVEVTDNTMCTNHEFEQLLEFIGKTMPQKNKGDIGSAYYRIREKTNSIMKCGQWPSVMRTSKYEIKAIRMYCKNGHKTYTKIPFKIAWIFYAISLLIDEIKQKGNVIPSNLQRFVNSTYAVAFYKTQINAYDAIHDEIPSDETARLALHGDFHDPGSPMNMCFQ